MRKRKRTTSAFIDRAIQRSAAPDSSSQHAASSDSLVLDFQWVHERSVHILHLLPLTSTSSESGYIRTGSVPVGARDHEAHVVHPPVSHHALGQLSRGVCGVKHRVLK